MAMQKWEYAHAIYDGCGLDPHIDMSGMSGPGSLNQFLQEAGDKGWEICAVLPYPTAQKRQLDNVELAVIFKRPLEDTPDEASAEGVSVIVLPTKPLAQA